MHDFIKELYQWANDASTINERTWRHQCIMRTVERMQAEALAQARTLEPIITRETFPPPVDPYTPYVEYGFPPKEKEDEANVVEGSIVQPVTDEGRLL